MVTLKKPKLLYQINSNIRKLQDANTEPGSECSGQGLV